jgi:hypothetical protein
MIGNFKPICLSRRIVVDIKVGAFVESMKERTRTWALEIVVDVREAVACQPLIPRLVPAWHTLSVSALRQEVEALLGELHKVSSTEYERHGGQDYYRRCDSHARL